MDDVDHGSASATGAILEAPRFKLVVWPDAGHMLSLERPDAFARLVGDFLDVVVDGRFDGRPSGAPASSGFATEAAR